MGFSVVSSPTPAVQITDVGGHVVFNTSDRLFAATNSFTGTLTIPDRALPANVDVDTTIGTLPTGSTFVRGAFKITSYTAGGGLGGIPVEQWYAVGGSYIRAQSPSVVAVYTFVVVSGTLRLRERLAARLVTLDSGQTINVCKGFTMSYYLLVGRFT
jgi:hypothetical protein